MDAHDWPLTIPGFLAGMPDDDARVPDVHMCARCDSPIDDPLEECPVCALEEDGGAR
jgi:hypothetical protein